MPARMKVGVIGCGNISDTYFSAGRKFPVLEFVACADLDLRRAEAQAAKYGLRACTVDQLLADPDIELVINLTVPGAHYAVALSVIEAGKHAYNEKPLALTRAEGAALLEAAQRKNVRLGGAPDTFLSGPQQTARKLIDDGYIGRPVAATAFMMGHGPEAWHPDPEFFYKPGAGPLYDMGPYYLTALINLLGPVRSITAAAQISFPEREITSQPKHGTLIKVEVPTHTVGLLHFASGALGTLITSFDVWAAELPRMEIYGSEGTLSVPDPNLFDGVVRGFHHEKAGWETIPLTHGLTENSRSVGAADLAEAVHEGRPQRASGELVFHVLDVMQTIHEAAAQGHTLPMNSTCERPAPLPALNAGRD